MKSRRKRRLPFAVYAALTFNLAICVTPFIAARAISTAYGDKRPAYEATSEAISATRQAMDNRFAKLAANGEGEARDVWSSYVREQLEANNMSAVEGLLQAAPAMLDGADGAALKARVAVADDTGEHAVLSAAVVYLPEDVQDEYERRRSASPLAMFKNSALGAAAEGAKPAVAQPRPRQNSPEPKSTTSNRNSACSATCATCRSQPPDGLAMTASTSSPSRWPASA